MTSSTSAKFLAYARLVRDLPTYLRTPMTAELARRMVTERLQNRERNFIRLLQQAVFRRPTGTYYSLFQWAGFDQQRAVGLVEDLGLEAALKRFDEAGVHLSFEEFKGRKAIERPGLFIEADDIRLDNPLAPGHFAAQTGGSTGKGTRVWLDLQHRHQQGANYYIATEAQGLLGATACLWRPPLPAGSGVGSWLSWSKVGIRTDHWYLPQIQDSFRPQLSHRLFMAYAYLVGNLVGVGFPKPEHLPLDKAWVVAEWAAETVRREGVAHVGVSTSMALRVALAAQSTGLSLRGVAFSGGGEPLTPAKVERILASGARLCPSYFLTEAGALGMQCGEPLEINDQHFFSDCFALRLKEREIPGTETRVNAFQLTSLLFSAPRVMVNVEIDDYGIVEARECNCALGNIGLTTHLRRVQSHQKLTGEGMSLVGSDMLHILHELLPARFGGSALDYQLEERQDSEGFTRMIVRVSPHLPLTDPEAVIQAVLEGLAQLDKGSDLARAIWSEAGSFQVERIAPEWTDAGKLPPLLIRSKDQEQPAAKELASESDDAAKGSKRT